jgi:transposase
MSKNLLYLGLDVHAQTVAIAIAEADGEVRNYGSVSGRLGSLGKDHEANHKRASRM